MTTVLKNGPEATGGSTIGPPATQMYRVVVLHRSVEGRLFYVRDSRLVHLVVQIAQGARIARAVTEALRNQYGIETLQLAVVRGEDSEPCALHELLTETFRHPHLESVAAFEDLFSLLTPPQEHAVRAITMHSQSRGRFARLGWFSELKKVVGVGELSQVEHWNCSKDFCLLSFHVGKQKYWFKAVGENNQREYPITKLLIEKASHVVPTMAYDLPQWNGWVMKDVAGKRLSDASEPSEIESVVAGLARLQRGSIGFLDALRNAGAVDWTQSQILSSLDAFHEEALRAAQAQISFRVPPLNLQQLCELRNEIEATLNFFADLNVPDTLVHGDIGHGNIQVTSHGPIFLDWAEAYVGNPFLSLEHLLADLERQNAISQITSRRLWADYAAHWGIALGHEKRLQGLPEKSAGLAAYIYGMFAWESLRKRNAQEDGWLLMRSMLRRSAREFEKARTVPR